MQRNIAAGTGEQGNNAFALAQRTKLLGAANFRAIGARRHQRQDHLGVVDRAFDFAGADRAAGEAPRIEPGVKALRREGPA